MIEHKMNDRDAEYLMSAIVALALPVLVILGWKYNVLGIADLIRALGSAQ